MFEQLKSWVLETLGKKSLDKNAQGKSVLSAEDKKKLVDAYGEKFLEKFEVDLTEFEKTGKDNFAGIVDKKLAEMQQVIDKTVSEKTKLTEEILDLKSKVDKLAAEGESDPPAKIEKKDGKRVITIRPNMKLAHNKAAESVLHKNDRSVLMSTIDVDDVITEFGDLVNYYTPDMLTEIMDGFDTSAYLTWKFETNSYKATKAVITSVVQQFVPKWTPLGSTKFTPREIPLRRFKVNLPITPAEVKDWILQMYREDQDLDQQPITKYIINNLLIPKVKEDIEMLLIATGSYVELDWDAVSEDDAGQATQYGMDGFYTQLVKAKASGTSNINFLLDGETINSSNIVTKFNDFVDAIDRKYRSKNMPIFVSDTIHRMYKRAYQTLFSVTKNEDEKKDYIDFSNQRLVVLPSMSGCEGFFTTPKENFIGVRHINEPGETKLLMQKERYNLLLFAEFRLGVGFAMEEAVFAYIPDEGSGSGSGA